MLWLRRRAGRLAMTRWMLVLALALAPRLAAAQDATEPQFWEVTGLGAGETLNLRAEPATGGAVVAELARGTVLHNLGCSGDGAATWCEVELAEGGPQGWVSGRYLTAYDEPAADIGDGGRVPGMAPTGTVFCQLGDAEPDTCAFATQRKEDGAVELVVTFADGFERILDFQGGTVFSPDPTDEVTATRGDGKTVVEVNAVERIEVPDAVVRPE